LRKLADVSGRGGLSFLDDQHVQLPGGRVVSVRAPGAAAADSAPPSTTPTAATPTAATPTAATPTAATARDGGVEPESPTSAPDGGVNRPTAGGNPLPPARPNAGLIVDPSGRFRVQRLGQSCGAYVVEIAALDPILHGPERVARVAAREDATCPTNTPPTLESNETGGFVALGWAPQGLLIGRAQQAYVVPLNAEARPAGEPLEVLPGALPPAPVSGPAVLRDGSQYLTFVDAGVVLHTLTPERSATLLRPAGWSELSGPLRAVALAPSGRAAVVHRGDAVYLLTW
jgi:hypothetical protein